MNSGGEQKQMGEGLLLPKPVRKKKRMRHKASILGSTKGVCYLCEKLYGDSGYKYTERHHIMFGSGKRKDSEELGLTVDLCIMHHREGEEAVHNNAGIRGLLCREAQTAFERTHTRKEWMGRGFKDYLEPEEAAGNLSGKENEQVAAGSTGDTGKRNNDQAAAVSAGNTGRQENAQGAAGSIEIGEYIGYIWNGNTEYGYVIDYGPDDTVWVGEEPDAWVRRLVETGRIFR